MPPKKMSTQERDRVLRRYRELIVSVKRIYNEFDRAADEHFMGDRALDVFNLVFDYNDECNAVERTLIFLAAQGDTRTMGILNDDGIKKFRASRAAFVQRIKKAQQEVYEEAHRLHLRNERQRQSGGKNDAQRGHLD